MGMSAEAQFHVLAVDDSIIDRKLIERLLKTSSYQVTTVDSGSKALQFLGLLEDEQRNLSPPSVSSDFHQEIEVNLIITDYCMPGMTGYDLLKKIKESSSFKDIPVVIMSSENVPSRISRCLEEGAEEFFLKPVKLSDVKKLKPVWKGKSKDQQLQTNLPLPPPPEEQKLQGKDVQVVDDTILILEPQQQCLTEVLSEKEQVSSIEIEQVNNNNKRKTMEEEVSPERTRPRYTTGLTMV
ncbi:hypothetical protein C5167_045815 [Papaver somniferum]|uniref:Response regulatory domain-containing protein n=1 Tax=Papaver somniferum TaxID=3469 RepID=A0A4Y7LFN2_PAPSO|nr:two-component response regulator ORR9-like [Papaver somniferum]RZC83029.1 hypothetical protein C5167_045815 [Papaver somniferum]